MAMEAPRMTEPQNDQDRWLAQVVEEIIDPERPIVDPHHHLWNDIGVMPPYLLEHLWADTDSGHNIVKTVFLECEVHFDPANKPSRRGSNRPKIKAKLNQQINPDFNRFLK